MKFDDRVRSIVSEDMKDIYRLFQDMPGHDQPNPPNRTSLEMQILNRMEELKSEIRRIEEAVTPSEEEISEEKRRQVEEAVKDAIGWLIDIFDQDEDDDLDPADVIKAIWKIIKGTGLAGDWVVRTLIGPAITSITNAWQQGWTRNYIAALKNRIDTLAADWTRMITDVKRDLIHELHETEGTLDNHLYNIEDCCTRNQERTTEVLDEVRALKDKLASGVTIKASPIVNDVYQKIMANGGDAPDGASF